MSENVAPSEGAPETCLFDYIIHDFALWRVIFLGRRGAGDLLRLSTVSNLTIFLCSAMLVFPGICKNRVGPVKFAGVILVT